MIHAESGVPTPQEPEITEEMIERAAEAMAGHSWSMLTEANREHHRKLARRGLPAALAGRTVVALPEPTERHDECDVMAATWRLTKTSRYHIGDYIQSYEVDGEPMVFDGPGPEFAFTVAEMRERCLAGLAACLDAERLASESRKDGETPMNTPTFAPASSWVRKRRHLARVDQLQDDPKRPGRYGKAICNQDGGRVYDQDWITAELKKWGLPPLRLADLPLCKRCERTANRLGGAS